MIPRLFRRVSDFLQPARGRRPKSIRDRVTYRAARRNIAKISYRHAKRAKRKVS
jgi:hypothetical protein